MFLAMLSAVSVAAQPEQDTTENQDIIEYMGDRYVIHVDAMQPDRETTLMDVLQTCPEFLSNDGKRITQNYEIRFDNVTVSLDDETLLQGIKASDLSTVEVYVYTSVAIGGGGDAGIIDLYFKEQDAGKTSGKLLLEGSTRGNGKAYADVVSRCGDVTVRGYALANLQYARGPLADMDSYSARQGQQHAHLCIDWNISEADNLKIKLQQFFIDGKLRTNDATDPFTVPLLQRYWNAVASYTHTFNEQGASLLAEGGADWLKATDDALKQQDCFAYYFTEASLPCLNQDLNILAGWEIDYFNTWRTGLERQHMMFNDVYLQLDYTKGPWVLTVGDRLRFVNYWHRLYDAPDAALWRSHRTENSFLVSAGYKAGHHFLQGVLNSDYLVPFIDDLYSDYDAQHDRITYRTDYRTNRYWRTEARYAYQQPNLIVNANVLHSWTTHGLMYDEQYTGLTTSVSWWKGGFRLTAGADYYHQKIDMPDYEGRRHYNHFNLRLLPSLRLGGGLRLSSMLLYKSRRTLILESHPHLYASVKASKDFGRHLTVSADFHDLAGSPTLLAYQVGESYDNRALTLGLTYRF